MPARPALAAVALLVCLAAPGVRPASAQAPDPFVVAARPVFAVVPHAPLDRAGREAAPEAAVPDPAGRPRGLASRLAAPGWWSCQALATDPPPPVATPLTPCDESSRQVLIAHPPPLLALPRRLAQFEGLVGTALVYGPAEDVVRLDSTVESQVGTGTAIVVSLPGTSPWAGADRVAETAELTVGVEQALAASADGSRTLAAGVQFTLPGAPVLSSPGHGTPLYAPFVTAGLQRGRTSLQAILSVEMPAVRRSWAERAVGYGLFVGRDLSTSATGWTVGAELSGENRAVALTPQLRKALTTSGSVTAGLGVQVPLNRREEEAACALVFVAWDVGR